MVHPQKSIPLILGIAALLITQIFIYATQIQPLRQLYHNMGLEIGQPVDKLNGVIVYYNGSVSHVESRNLAPDGYNLGLKYQCVEFVKRYYYEYFHHKMPNSYGHAKDFFNPKLSDGAINKDRNLIQNKNGGSTTPQIHDIVVWDGNEWNPFGHVAIVSAVYDHSIEITQQNPGPTAPSRIQIELNAHQGKFSLNDSEILGWLHKK